VYGETLFFYFIIINIVKKGRSEVCVTPRFPNNVNNTNNQSIQRKTECHTTFET